MVASPLAATVVTAILRCDFCAAKFMSFSTFLCPLWVWYGLWTLPNMVRQGHCYTYFAIGVHSHLGHYVQEQRYGYRERESSHVVCYLSLRWHGRRTGFLHWLWIMPSRRLRHCAPHSPKRRVCRGAIQRMSNHT